MSVTGLVASSSGDPFGSSFSADKAIDGSLTTGWAANNCGVGQWLQVNFDAACIASVDLRNRDQSNAPGQPSPLFRVTTSDGQSVDHAFLAGTNTTVTIALASTNITWIRITFMNAGCGGAQIGEVGNPGWSNVVPADVPCAKPRNRALLVGF